MTYMNDSSPYGSLHTAKKPKNEALNGPQGATIWSTMTLKKSLPKVRSKIILTSVAAFWAVFNIGTGFSVVVTLSKKNACCWGLLKTNKDKTDTGIQHVLKTWTGMGLIINHYFRLEQTVFNFFK
jgi:hypothetical protein